MRNGVVIIGLLVAHWGSGCQQHPDLTPVPSRVTPEVVAAGQERYVVIEGENFMPTLTWNADEEGVSLSSEFAVRIGSVGAPEVTVASTNRLVAKIPGDLAPGWHPVTVRGPGGLEATLPDALCVDDQPYQELLHGLVQNQVMNLCATQTVAGEVRTVVEDIVPGVYEGTGQNQTSSLWRGYSLSPDGQLLAFLRSDDTNHSLSLGLVHLVDDWEATLAEVQLPANETNPTIQLSPPSFSQDSRMMVYAKSHNQLVLQEVPDDPQVIPDPTLLLQDSEDTILIYPEIDPAGRFVLYTRIQEMDPAVTADDLVTLHIVPLVGGLPRVLGEDNQPGFRNGPGTFLPSGNRVLFVSDRLDIQIPTPFGTMGPATNLFTVGIFGGPAEPVTKPKAAYLYGKPVVSPDGRMAAITGFLSDVSGSGADIIVADLQTGAFGRLWPDPTPFCFPQDNDRSCEAGNYQNDTLTCCSGPEGAQNCCRQGTQEYCPSWDMGPEFGPDSRSIYANAFSIQWACEQDAPGFWSWRGNILGIYIYRIDFDLSDEAIIITNGVVYPFPVLQLPLAPLYRQVTTCR